MKTSRVLLFAICGFSAVGLSACGEGYVAVPYHGVPYTEERTAGYGVQYVRDHILPEKGPVLPQTLTPVAETTVHDAAPLFSGKQLKK